MFVHSSNMPFEIILAVALKGTEVACVWAIARVCGKMPLHVSRPHKPPLTERTLITSVDSSSKPILLFSVSSSSLNEVWCRFNIVCTIRDVFVASDGRSIGIDAVGGRACGQRWLPMMRMTIGMCLLLMQNLKDRKESSQALLLLFHTPHGARHTFFVENLNKFLLRSTGLLRLSLCWCCSVKYANIENWIRYSCSCSFSRHRFNTFSYIKKRY